MKIKFKNGSTIETIKSQVNINNNNTRGNRSNFITCMCYDTIDYKSIMKTLDMREPIGRYVPEYLIDGDKKG